MGTKHIRRKKHISACPKTMFTLMEQTDKCNKQTNKSKFTRKCRDETYGYIRISFKVSYFANANVFFQVYALKLNVLLYVNYTDK